MVDLTGIDQFVALLPADVEAIEPVILEREAGDRQGLALRASDLDPIVTIGRNYSGYPGPSTRRPRGRSCRRA